MRASGDVSHIAIDPDDATYDQRQTFVTNNSGNRIASDLGTGPGPILAVHSFDGDYIIIQNDNE